MASEPGAAQATSATAAGQQPHEVPEAMKEYLAATQPMEKSYDELTLEEKFEYYKQKKERQHPLYQTSSGSYGVVPTGLAHVLEKPKHAKHGRFSKEFASSGNYRTSGLSTGMPRSKFLRHNDGAL